MSDVDLETENQKKKDPDWPEIVDWIINSAIEYKLSLSEWEQDFLAKLSAEFTSETFELTEKQQTTLMALLKKILKYVESRERLQG